MATCLFTGEELGSGTLDEHTIPKKLGGRIVSKLVSSSRFNNRSSRPFDEAMVAAYHELMHELTPLLPRPARSARLLLKDPTGDRTYALPPGGPLEIAGCEPLAYDWQTKKPTVFRATDEAALQRMMDQLGLTEQDVVHFETPVTTADVLFGERLVISPKMQVSAMKSLLLTFDALLTGYDEPWTRCADLAPVREAVRSVVMGGAEPAGAPSSHMLSINYAKADAIRDLRRRAFGSAGRAFEHVLVVSGNQPSRCLDAAWLVLGTDPFCFRLSERWNGHSFTSVVRCDILLDGGYEISSELPFEASVAALADLGPMGTQEEQQSAKRGLAEQIVCARTDAYRRAVYLVETTADGHVASCLKGWADGLARAAGVPVLVREAMEQRMRCMYSDRLEDPSKDAAFGEIAAQVAATVSEAQRGNMVSADGTGWAETDWSLWVDAHHRLLEGLVGAMGLPGVMFTSDLREAA